MTLTTRAAIAAAALLTLGAVDARAQFIELPMGAGTPQGLTAHQIRVVQFALRDTDCYNGPISGRWTAATRRALQCARQRTSAADNMALARELALWTADGMTTRSMAGDVAPASGNAPRAASGNPSSNMSGNTPRSATGTVSGTPSTNTTGATSGSAAMRDTTMRGTMPMRDTTMRGAMPMRDTSATMPMTPRDTLSAMSRMGTTTAMRDSTMANRTSDTVSGRMSGNMDHAAMLTMQMDSLVTAAESGLAEMPAARSGALLQSVETHLAGTPGLADLGPEFATLRTQLATMPRDSAQIGRTMASLSTRINAAAASAPADMQDRLRRLGTALGNEGRRLNP